MRTRMLVLVSSHVRRGMFYISDIEKGYIKRSYKYNQLKDLFERKYQNIALSYRDGVIYMIGVMPLTMEQAEARTMDKLLRTYDILVDFDNLCALARNSGNIEDVALLFNEGRESAYA